MERYAKVLKEYDTVIDRLKAEITKKYQEDMQDLDRQKVHMREMLRQTISSELPSSSTNNRQQSTLQTTNRHQQQQQAHQLARKVILSARPISSLASQNQARQGSSQNAINGEEVISNGSVTSPGQKRKSSISSASERPRIERTASQTSHNNRTESQQQQLQATQRSNSLSQISQTSQTPVKRVLPLKISTKNTNISINSNNNADVSINKNVNNDTNNIRINNVTVDNTNNNANTNANNNTNNTLNNNPPAQENRLPPVKFKIVRDSNNSTTNYQHVSTENTVNEQPSNQSQPSSAQNQTQRTIIKEEEDDDYQEYEIVDEANKTSQASQDNPEGSSQQEGHEENMNDAEMPDGDDPMNDENYMEESNMPLPEADPYHDDEEFELPEFSNADHSQAMSNIRVKMEFEEGEGASDKTACVFCGEYYQNCGINRHSDRCWILHGKSNRWVYCTFPDCSYGTKKSKYSHIYCRKHLAKKHGIISESEADKYIASKVLHHR